MNYRSPGSMLAVALFLAGCGLKGPLYLPEKSGDVAIRPAPQDGIKPSAPPTASTPPPPTTAPETEAEPAPTQEPPRGDGGG